MQRLVSLALIFGTASTLACENIETTIIQSDIRALVVSPPSASADEICTIVDIVSPLFIESANSNDLVANAAIYSSSGTLIAATELSTSIADDKYVSTGCMPLASDYIVKIAMSYHPVGEFSLCPQKIVIDNLATFMNQSQ
ncbi:hypothetical protein [Pseudidiomarina mangrovi]|uniref:hypothetical protein n=1 Tax=Pseudidiomarina mangrovi TaxID=2487133 RepID=UPI000FCC4871|nr:hypothetical protein [Pseudidiomarina mangrovi]